MTAINKTQIKSFNKEAGMNTSADFLESAEEVFEKLLEGARETAKANGRTTVQAKDLRLLE